LAAQQVDLGLAVEQVRLEFMSAVAELVSVRVLALRVAQVSLLEELAQPAVAVVAEDLLVLVALLQVTPVAQAVKVEVVAAQELTTRAAAQVGPDAFLFITKEKTCHSTQ
jgi:hypothetical protein